MRALLTGAAGQLGRELQLTCPTGTEMTALGHADLDLTDSRLVETRVAEMRPDVVINTAAYTAVDRAESERDLAFAVNEKGVANLAQAARAVDARLIHISTDFVFAGDRARPYLPEDETGPLSVYGASKLAGEGRLRAIAPDQSLIIRTAWVYSRFGHNFVKTMLRLLAERSHLEVVVDQVGAPSWARSLAGIVWASCSRAGLRGVFHWTDAGVASWYDFAIAIQEEATDLGLLESNCQIRPISTTDYPSAARRPGFSVLDTRATVQQLGIEPVHWRRQLRAMLQDLRSCGED